MAITESWVKANNKKERAKALTKTDRDGLYPVNTSWTKLVN